MRLFVTRPLMLALIVCTLSATGVAQEAERPASSGTPAPNT
jgi:hypothetical protein